MINPSKIDVKLVTQFDGHKGSIYSLEQSEEAHLFYSGSFDNMVVEWSLKEPEKNKAVAKIPSKAFAIKFIKEKQLLLIGNYNGGIHVIDLNKNKEIKLLQYHQQIIFDIQYLPEKDCFFVLSADGSFSVWSVSNLTLIKATSFGEFKLRTIEFNMARNEAIIGCGDGSIRVLELEKFAQVNKFNYHQEGFSVNSLKLNPNRKYLLSGSRDAYLNLIDIENNYELVQKIPAHNYSIYSIVFNPESDLFATASMDKTVKIWDTNTCKMLLRINNVMYHGHTNSVNKLLWSQYKGYLISTGDDRTIKVWEVKKNKIS